MSDIVCLRFDIISVLVVIFIVSLNVYFCLDGWNLSW